MLTEEAEAQLALARKNANGSDDAFLDRLERGYKWQVLVANKLMAEGYAVQCQPLQVRPDRSQIEEYKDDYDLLVTRMGRGWKRHLEVKSRTLSFSSNPSSFPFGTIIVERSETFEGRNRLPDYWVMVSQKSKGVIAVSSKSVRATHSTETKRGTDYIVCPKESFISFDEMLETFPT
jgi:hypothetical protein